MVEGPRRLRLVLEALEPLDVLREVGVDDLEGDVPREPLVAGAVDLAHAALAEKRDDVVGADPSARAEARGSAHATVPVSVVLLPDEVRNTSTAGPMQISSPSASSVAVVTGLPRRKVPFLLPRSSRMARAPSTRIRA